MKHFTVYVLKSLIGNDLYIGCTSDLEKRVETHNKGRVFSTRQRTPLKLIYSENYDDKYQAYRTERLYKTPKGKRILRKKIHGQSCGVV